MSQLDGACRAPDQHRPLSKHHSQDGIKHITTPISRRQPKHMACDEGGLAGGQKQNRVYDLAWFPGTLHRHRRNKARFSFPGAREAVPRVGYVCGPD